MIVVAVHDVQAAAVGDRLGVSCSSHLSGWPLARLVKTPWWSASLTTMVPFGPPTGDQTT